MNEFHGTFFKLVGNYHHIAFNIWSRIDAITMKEHYVGPPSFSIKYSDETVRKTVGDKLEQMNVGLAKQFDVLRIKTSSYGEIYLNV